MKDKQMNAKPEIIPQGAFVHVADYLTGSQADELFVGLQKAAPWREEWIHLYGRDVRVPRLVSWYGDPGLNYRYSGNHHTATGWPEQIEALRSRLSEFVGTQFNFVLLNRYRTGADYMGWHTDDEAEMGSQIASISLGATRRFLLEAATDGKDMIELAHGSLLTMRTNVRHSLPRTSRPVGERINLTFRRIVAI